MITSFVTIQCTNEKQITALKNYRWATHCPTPTMLQDGLRVTMKNGLQEGGFENDITGVAIHFVRQCPGVPFTIAAWLDNPESYYRETLDIESNGCDIIVKLATSDTIFTHRKTCIDCGASLESVYNAAGFQCPNCGSTYLPTGHPDERHADQVFGSASCTYSIPQHEINAA